MAGLNEPAELSVAIGHPTGNQFFRHLVGSLDGAGMLTWVGTCLRTNGFVDQLGSLLPTSLRDELARRSFADLKMTPIHSRPWREMARVLTERAPVPFISRSLRNNFTVDAVYRDFDQWMARQLTSQSHVYAYEDSALCTFGTAHRRGVRRVYDLPIAYWRTLRTLLTEEAERLPAWSPTLGGGITDSPEKLERKTRELELAELVIVPSRFVADSLPDRQSKLTCLSAFGSPPMLDETAFQRDLAAREQRIRDHAPLRVLFVGSMSQRKGLGDLMAAARGSVGNAIELVVLGSLQAERSFYERECPGFIHEAGRPHAQVLQLMRSCDVFCLPSIVEGRALVIQEAMSQGLPVIITPNTGADDVVVTMESSVDADEASAGTAKWIRGSTGVVVPIRSPESIREVLLWCCQHRQTLIEMGIAARSKSATYTWHDYGQTIRSAIGSLDTRQVVGP